MKGKIIKWSLLVLLLGYWAGMTIWAREQARTHVCTGIEIDVEGKHTMDSVIRAGITTELHGYPHRIVGSQLNQLNTVEIEQYLSRLNNFERVNCFFSPRGALVVKVLPLVPVMRVFSNGKSYYVNKDGKRIESNAEFYSDVPVVTGNFSSKFTPRDIMPIVNFVRKDKTMRELTSMIEARNANNILIVPRMQGHVINFGDTTRLQEKMRTLSMFYHQVMPYKGWQQYDTISVKYRGQVVATRRNKAILNHSEDYEEEVDLEEGTLPDAGNEATPPQKQNEETHE